MVVAGARACEHLTAAAVQAADKAVDPTLQASEQGKLPRRTQHRKHQAKGKYSRVDNKSLKG